MAKLIRVNLVVDAEQLGELARLLGKSKSEAVRQAVDQALAVEQANAEIRAYQESPAFKNTYGRWLSNADIESEQE